MVVFFASNRKNRTVIYCPVFPIVFYMQVHIIIEHRECHKHKNIFICYGEAHVIGGDAFGKIKHAVSG